MWPIRSSCQQTAALTPSHQHSSVSYSHQQNNSRDSTASTCTELQSFSKCSGRCDRSIFNGCLAAELYRNLQLLDGVALQLQSERGQTVGKKNAVSELWGRWDRPSIGGGSQKPQEQTVKVWHKHREWFWWVPAPDCNKSVHSNIKSWRSNFWADSFEELIAPTCPDSQGYEWQQQQ